MNLPNKLTIARIVLAFIFMVLLFCNSVTCKVLALLTFLAASFTDYLDGFIAKKFNITSDFGKIMDPVADKILTIAAFLAFVELKLVPAWTVAVIILRELVITSMRLRALLDREVLPAGMAGKQKTVSQIVTIVAILVFIVFKETGVRAFGFWNETFEYWYRQGIFIMMLVTVALTLISGFSYMLGNKKYLFGNGRM
ncbi:MAG: CDP-diacylglycerol--glycerol-3-phosphate 3-phosphatidyltransferase [Candidatus Omnitrophica bacterium]|nr:CDP-diacylglycerol--glycerol-3-phosphate 3-phosphatidyltransferase [Candidatus Omnitrophota bacterium]